MIVIKISPENSNWLPRAEISQNCEHEVGFNGYEWYVDQNESLIKTW